MSDSSLVRNGTFGVLGELTIRPNPRYRLMRFTELDERDRLALGNVAEDPTLYGALMPYEPGLTVKLVNHEIARLLSELEHVAPRNDAHKMTMRAASMFQVLDLVAAQILEVGHDGAFKTGLAAAESLSQKSIGEQSRGRLARLSVQAVDEVGRLELDNPKAIAARLYAFNRVPASESWRKRWPGITLREEIDKAVNSTLRSRLRDTRGWTREGSVETWSTYLCSSTGLANRLEQPMYKLYISPTPRFYVESLRRSLPIIRKSAGVIALKTGNDIYGALRPDKTIVYFVRSEALTLTADRLLSVLKDIPAQGVPFSAELSDTALLSWGVDPPRISYGQASVLSDSWRTWLTNRLGAALWQAKQAGLKGESMRDAAFRRLEIAGIDTERWMPRDSAFVQPSVGPDGNHR